MRDYDSDGVKMLCAAVLKRAADDYREHEYERDMIMDWLKKDPIYLAIALPDTDPEYVIRRFKEYGKE